MTPWLDDTDVTVWHGDCIQVMATLPEGSVDAIVTDPPYGLEFMGKDWDRWRVDDRRVKGWNGRGGGTHGQTSATSSELGGRVAYGGGKRPTTSRCQGCGKRDQMRKPHACPDGTTWRTEIIDPYSAPPTSLAFEEWVRVWALEAYRVLKPGGHLLAFGATRMAHRLTCGIEDAGFDIRDTIAWLYGSGFPKSRDPRHDNPECPPGLGTALKPAFEPVTLARKPPAGTIAANVMEHGTGALNIAATVIDDTDSPEPCRFPANVTLEQAAASMLDEQAPDTAGDVSRFFYTSKASTAERRGSLHPTVKPLDLMRWLIRLVTPPGGVVLDPFAGSGTTLEAARLEGFRAVGVELDPVYLPDIARRLQQLSMLGGAA